MTWIGGLVAWWHGGMVVWWHVVVAGGGSWPMGWPMAGWLACFEFDGKMIYYYYFLKPV